MPSYFVSHRTRMAVHLERSVDFMYGLIIHDGGTSAVTIQFCPWCGSKLPASKRDR